MKKFILSLLASLVVIASYSQERTITKTMAEGATYYKYTGVAADTLKPTNQDTIDFVLVYSGNYVNKLAVKTRFDTIAGADTTVSTSVFGKEFSDDDTYVQIIGATTSSAVTANNTVQVLASDLYATVAAAQDYIYQEINTNQDTVVVAERTITPFDKSYRYYRIRYILSGNDHVGTGIKIDEIEVKFYTE